MKKILVIFLRLLLTPAFLFAWLIYIAIIDPKEKLNWWKWVTGRGI